MSLSNRRSLMWVLLVLLIATLFLGRFGTIEVTIWFLLLAGWIAVFRTWAGRGPTAKG